MQSQCQPIAEVEVEMFNSPSTPTTRNAPRDASTVDGSKTEPENYRVINGWLAVAAGGCTCGTGGLHGGHEPGCGWEPIRPVEELLRDAAPVDTAGLRRPVEEIRADLADPVVAVLACSVDPRGALERLVQDVPSLLDRLAAAERERDNAQTENDRLLHGMAGWVAERIAPIQAERDAARARAEAAEAMLAAVETCIVAELISGPVGTDEAGVVYPDEAAEVARGVFARLAAPVPPQPVPPTTCEHGETGEHTYCPHNRTEATCRDWKRCPGPVSSQSTEEPQR